MADAELESRTRYDPAEAEPRVFARWEASGLFAPEPEGTAAENYSIAIPPPNVTGALHMGHALNGSIQDALVRLARMRGKRTRWILGTDHAGIGMQTQVEKLLRSEGMSREEIGREAFVERVWRFREEYGGQILQQYKRLGASADYEHERFTLDAEYLRAVLEVFVALYEKGLIYRDNYLVNWDPGTRSAISDLEVDERRVTDTLYYVDYPLASGHGSVTVATVRPETMLADTAIAVHPDDDRYTRLIGESALLPLVGRRLPIIADPYVKPEFGTGALKITPGHDANDFEIGRAHRLEEISVIGEDGRMTEAAGDFAGMPVAEAHAAVVERLRADGRIVRTEQYEHDVPFSQRSGERIEPLISLQWFMAMDELARPAIDVVRDGRVRIHPEGQEARYLDWMEKIRPWCISRQLWWGHQIPVWYRGEERYVGVEPPTGEGWTQDPDVLDTWFSSGLWPFATLGWPEDTPDLRAFYPTDVLLTARDILFLWVARMVMFGLEFAGDVPFDHVYVHSIIQAPDKRRMSKSLGTGIDPLDLIAGGPRPPVFTEGGEFPAYGADAVRFGLLAMSSTQDVRFNEEKIAQGRQLANKLWNAARLVLLRVPEGVTVPDTPPAPQVIEDRWILSRLQAAKADMATAIDAFDQAQLTASQQRLDHVAGVHRAFGGAGPDDGVHLVDERDDLAVGLGDLLEDGLQALLELAAVLRTGDHPAEVERDHALVLQPLGHVARRRSASARPSTIAVLPTPGSPIRTGLFLVRRDNTWMTRRISSSRPITGSSLPLRAASVRSRPYFSSALNVSSGFWEVTRWFPRTSTSADSTASRVTPTVLSKVATGPATSVSASSRCSVET